MMLSMDYKINKKLFKNSYSNDINTLKKLLNLDENATINDILKLSLSKKVDNNDYKIIINKEINGYNNNFYFLFSNNCSDKFYLRAVKILSNKTFYEIKKVYSLNNELFILEFSKCYPNDFSLSSYIKTYNLNYLKLTSIIFPVLKNNYNYYNDMQIYNTPDSKLQYIVNNKICYTFPINTKKYNKILNYIECSNEINLKKMRIYIIELYKNNELTIVQIKKLMNIINSKFLMLYLIN